LSRDNIEVELDVNNLEQFDENGASGIEENETEQEISIDDEIEWKQGLTEERGVVEEEKAESKDDELASLTKEERREMLFDAVLVGNKDRVRLLIDAAFDADDELGDTGVHKAAIHGEVDMLRLMLTSDARAATIGGNKMGSTPLHMAASCGHVECVRALLDASAGSTVSVDIDARDATSKSAAALACLYGRVSALRLLLEAGADAGAADEDGKQLLHLAVAGGAEAVRVLVECCGSAVQLDALDAQGQTALHLAAIYEGKADVARVLLDTGARIDIVNKAGHMPLHRASFQGRADVVDALLERRRASCDANSACAGSSGLTSLHLAATRGHVDVVRALIAGGANVDVVDAQGICALAYCAVKGHAAVAKALLDANARADIAAGANQMTPLHLASSNGHEDVVRVLVADSANATAKATTKKKSKMALDLARAKGHVRVAALLEEVTTPRVNSPRLLGASQLGADGAEGERQSALPPPLRSRATDNRPQAAAAAAVAAAAASSSSSASAASRLQKRTPRAPLPTPLALEAAAAESHGDDDAYISRAWLEQLRSLNMILDANDVRYEESDRLARGAYGTVYGGRWLEHAVAIKTVENDSIGFKREVMALSKLRSPYVVTLFGLCEKPANGVGSAMVIMELLSCSLFDVLHSPSLDGRVLSWSQRLQYALDMTRGAQFMHSRNLIHRDLKVWCGAHVFLLFFCCFLFLQVERAR
jgi:ankyrin repeat protein